nr:hypothetical protein RP007_01483 [Rhizobium sp. P007]
MPGVCIVKGKRRAWNGRGRAASSSAMRRDGDGYREYMIAVSIGYGDKVAQLWRQIKYYFWLYSFSDNVNICGAIIVKKYILEYFDFYCIFIQFIFSKAGID